MLMMLMMVVDVAVVCKGTHHGFLRWLLLLYTTLLYDAGWLAADDLLRGGGIHSM